MPRKLVSHLSSIVECSQVKRESHDQTDFVDWVAGSWVEYNSWYHVQAEPTSSIRAGGCWRSWSSVVIPFSASIWPMSKQTFTKYNSTYFQPSGNIYVLSKLWGQRKTYDFSPIWSICLSTVGLSSQALATKHRALGKRGLEGCVAIDIVFVYISSPCKSWVPSFFVIASSTTTILSITSNPEIGNLCSPLASFGACLKTIRASKCGCDSPFRISAAFSGMFPRMAYQLC